VEAHAAARKHAAVAEYARRRPEPGGPIAGAAQVPAYWDEFAPDELAWALAESRWAMTGLLDLACGLAADLPGTMAGFRADPGVPGHRRVPPGVPGQRLQRGVLVPAGAAPAGPVERGGDGLLRSGFEADGDPMMRHSQARIAPSSPASSTVRRADPPRVMVRMMMSVKPSSAKGASCPATDRGSPKATAPSGSPVAGVHERVAYPFCLGPVPGDEHVLADRYAGEMDVMTDARFPVQVHRRGGALDGEIGRGHTSTCPAGPPCRSIAAPGRRSTIPSRGLAGARNAHL
jgi:hypothetical protein